MYYLKLKQKKISQLDSDEDIDYAIFEVLDVQFPFLEKIPTLCNLRHNKKYISYGFPKYNNLKFLLLPELNIPDFNPDDKQINKYQILEPMGAPTSKEGYSGAPILDKGIANGWITEEINNSNIIFGRSFANKYFNQLYFNLDDYNIINHEWEFPHLAKEKFRIFMVQANLSLENKLEALDLFQSISNFFVGVNQNQNIREEEINQDEQYVNHYRFTEENIFDLLIFPELFLSIPDLILAVNMMGGIIKLTQKNMSLVHLGLRTYENKENFNLDDLKKLKDEFETLNSSIKISQIDLNIFRHWLEGINLKMKKKPLHVRVNILFYFNQDSTLRFCIHPNFVPIDNLNLVNVIQCVKLFNENESLCILPLTSYDLFWQVGNGSVKDPYSKLNEFLRNENKKIDIISVISTYNNIEYQSWEKFQEEFSSIAKGRTISEINAPLVTLVSNSKKYSDSIRENKKYSGFLNILNQEVIINKYVKLYRYTEHFEIYIESPQKKIRGTKFGWIEYKKEKNSAVKDFKSNIKLLCVYHKNSRAEDIHILYGVSVCISDDIRIPKVTENIKFKRDEENIIWEQAE